MCLMLTNCLMKDATFCAVIPGFPSMSWASLSRRGHLFPYLKQLRCTTYQSRSVIDFHQSSYNFIGHGTEYCQNFYNDVWGLTRRHVSSTGLFNNSYRSQPLGSQCFWKCSSMLNVRRHYASQASTEKKSQKMLLYLTALVFAMVGSSYAAVPLYRRFCQATGYGGTIQRKESVEEKIARHAKDGTITKRCGLSSYKCFLC
ncbi:cytochrome c oxidase assembly protein COX11, mitochondrial-like isoform X1 [Carica papaya]|uniref:cytochrome c oxidase assembly protein COX11, mitochondrial-like isoform X1 n=2 Tax=Carica papaya TaxID=3649 RepID=UPI000B8CD4B5|nr:cytochrome c oxidase assembly protein COX11, mitochondrial-like isoform X1 [Carica papaya]